MTETIIKADDFFKRMFEISNETRRWLVGKYSPKGAFDIDFEKTIPIYKGDHICSREFDFTVEGTRCQWCNSLCLLTKEGHFNDKEIIPIRSGSYRGQELQVFKYPIPSVPFGTYKSIQPKVKSDINRIRDICKRQWMQNQSDDVSHDIAISSLLNSNNYPFRSRTISGWICNDVNVIKLVPTLGSFKTAIFTPDLFKNTFFQLYMMSMIGVFSHGDPNANVLYLSNIPSSLELGSTKVQMTSTLFMDLSEYSSYTIDYDGRFLYYVGKSHMFDIKEPDWNMEFKITSDKLLPRQHTKSPSKQSYLNSRMTTIVPSVEIMNYIRQTGINVFPYMYFIIYMTIALMNHTFNELFMKSEAKKIFSKIFIEGEFEKYMSIISSHLGATPTCDEIITLLNNEKIHIRDDSIECIKNDMVTYITGK